MESAPSHLVRLSSGWAADSWGESDTVLTAILPRFGCAETMRGVIGLEISSASLVSSVAQNFCCTYYSAQCPTTENQPLVLAETTPNPTPRLMFMRSTA